MNKNKKKNTEKERKRGEEWREIREKKKKEEK